MICFISVIIARILNFDKYVTGLWMKVGRKSVLARLLKFMNLKLKGVLMKGIMSLLKKGAFLNTNISA